MLNKSPITCSVCGKEYKFEHHFKKHMENKHPPKDDNQDDDNIEADDSWDKDEIKKVLQLSISEQEKHLPDYQPITFCSTEQKQCVICLSQNPDVVFTGC